MAEPDSKQLLQELLTPLLEDFHYWFEKSIKLLDSNRIEFLAPSDQKDLLARVRSAQAELNSAQQLYNLSDNTVGIDPKLVVQWHRLLMECGGVGQRFRQIQAEQSSAPNPADSMSPDNNDRDVSTG